LVRRMVAGIPTNQLNRIFIEITPQVAAATHDIVGVIHELLSARARRWPDDETIRAAVKNQPFYKIQRPAQRQFVLRRLAEDLGEFEPDWSLNSNTQVEHIMPQTLSQQWLSYLIKHGDDAPTQMHSDLVDVIGNLTLTVYNQSLSQKPYDEKRTALTSMAGEPLTLTKMAYNAEVWNREAILKRCEELGERIIKLWQGPVHADAAALEWLDLFALVSAIPEGSWTDFATLAQVVDVDALMLQQRVYQDRPHGGHRLLLNDGKIDPNAPWGSPASPFESILVQENVLVSVGAAAADPGAFLDASALELLRDTE